MNKWHPRRRDWDFAEILKAHHISKRVRNIMGFMSRTLATAFLFLSTLVSVISAQEIDVSSLEKIGPVTGFVKTEKGITLNCRDNLQVNLTVLAPDLVFVGGSFKIAIFICYN